LLSAPPSSCSYALLLQCLLLLPLHAIARTALACRFYLAFDHNDRVYESAAWRDKVEEFANRLFAEEDARRPHTPGYVPGATIDNSTLLMSLHWVHCPHSAKPAWAHSDASIAAVKEGADYVYRTNDDTAFPAAQDWVDRFVRDLRDRQPVRNLGVVGPSCGEGAKHILTHDFTHRTHAAIFGYHYPPTLPDWSSDDWITYVYQAFQLMSKRHDVLVIHRMHGQRYHASSGHLRLRVLNAELRTGAETLTTWLQAHYNTTLPYEVPVITCCR